MYVRSMKHALSLLYYLLYTAVSIQSLPQILSELEQHSTAHGLYLYVSYLYLSLSIYTHTHTLSLILPG